MRKKGGDIKMIVPAAFTLSWAWLPPQFLGVILDCRATKNGKGEKAVP
jgi:hypothetical protein